MRAMDLIEEWEERLRRAQAEIERLRALLSRLYSVAAVVNDIRLDSKIMREVRAELNGQLAPTDKTNKNGT